MLLENVPVLLVCHKFLPVSADGKRDQGPNIFSFRVRGDENGIRLLEERLKERMKADGHAETYTSGPDETVVQFPKLVKAS